MMKKGNHITILCAFLLIFSFAAAGCMKAGSNEIVSTGGNAGDSHGTEQSGGDDTGNQRYEVVLTEEEANQNHLTTKLSDLVEVDAYMTPYDLYMDGVGQWHRNSPEEAEDDSLFSEVDPDDTVLNTVTFSAFLDAIDQMAQTLGPIYQEAWEATKGVDNIDYFHLYPDYGIYIGTGGHSIGGGSTLVTLLEEPERLSFMSWEDAAEAAQIALNELGLDASEHVLVMVNDDDSYAIDFPETVDGIPITYCRASCRIQAGDMSPDSMWYHERYETEEYAMGGSGGMSAATITVGEEDFNLLLEAKDSFTLYREAQDVIDINDVLETAGQVLYKHNRAIIVKNIELGMGNQVVGEEGEKKRIVLSPYWNITYYMRTNENSEEDMSRQMLTIDAYTGEVMYDGGI